MIKVLYSILLGAIVALFIGLGIEVFYPGEKAPETPAALQYSVDKTGTAPATIEAQKEFDQIQKAYNERAAKHSRNVSIVALSASILLMIISLLIVDKIIVFSNGILLGSLFTLIYGIIRGMMTEDVKFRFIIVTVGMLFALALGWFKFEKAKDAKK
ncbi:MAG: hypothetical protein WC227_04015 [Patescibacteria group bacterium]|jgi:hypothetical protein